jgi:hypothetical protein
MAWERKKEIKSENSLAFSGIWWYDYIQLHKEPAEE